MRHFLFALILLLGVCATVRAQPVDSEAYVADARNGQPPQLIVVQDPCYAFFAPVFTVNVAVRSVRVVHRAQPAGCGTPPPPSTFTYPVPGSFPIGTWTFEYVLEVSSGPAVPPRTGTFVVRPAEQRNLTFDPILPIALEPVRLTLSFSPVCQRMDSVRPIDGGFRVVKVRRVTPPCGNTPIVQDFTLGAFAPGNYQIEVALLTPEGLVVEEQATLVVRGSMTTETFESGASVAVDLSGLWYSPLDAPSTGLSLIHARNPPAPGTSQGSDVITVLWYLYDAEGAPVWYVIVAEDDANGTRTGPVLEFNGSGSQIGSNPVGTATLSFDAGSATGRVRAQIGTRTFDFRIERFRWPIRAWPTGPNFFPPS